MEAKKVTKGNERKEKRREEERITMEEKGR